MDKLDTIRVPKAEVEALRRILEKQLIPAFDEELGR